MGYGNAIHLAGMSQYGQKMRDDIEHAVAWVANQQGLDPKRVVMCIDFSLVDERAPRSVSTASVLRQAKSLAGAGRWSVCVL